jgi:hypothetical protein
MNNFYELFDILNSASTREIIRAYKSKIVKYSNLKKLNEIQINEIKMLKIGLHILINPLLRNKYDKRMNLNKIDEPTEPTEPIEPNEPNALNDINDIDLDGLFNVDNSWMKNYNMNVDSNDKKLKFETNISDRVFSLSNMNKRPGFSSDFEASIRKPLQGREDKSSELINKHKM